MDQKDTSTVPVYYFQMIVHYSNTILEARNTDISLTHEAAVGKISDIEIEYLETRGLPEEEARGLIIRGFLEANTTNLPEALAKETERLIAAVADSEMA